MKIIRIEHNVEVMHYMWLVTNQPFVYVCAFSLQICCTTITTRAQMSETKNQIDSTNSNNAWTKLR